MVCRKLILIVHPSMSGKFMPFNIVWLEGSYILPHSSGGLFPFMYCYRPPKIWLRGAYSPLSVFLISEINTHSQWARTSRFLLIVYPEGISFQRRHCALPAKWNAQAVALSVFLGIIGFLASSTLLSFTATICLLDFRERLERSINGCSSQDN